ncbi:MAG: lipid A deacylase LpxR family protein [Alphaproteobacteria bacterium]|nr:lipid A deacylase LpxR family protein [Alphaproteobacteria bacterium]
MTPRLLACLLFLIGTAPAYAEARKDGATISATFENDIFGGTDQNYTNGVRLDYVSGKNDLRAPGRWLRARVTPFIGKADWYGSFALGQNMYTPSDISLSNPPADDRPYAGFLYASFGLAADRGSELDLVAVDIGVVGDASLAKETQTLVHELIGAQEPNGWDNQIGNFPGFRILYEKKYRFQRVLGDGFLDLAADFAPHFNVALGNIDTSIGAGFTIRVGGDLADDYGPPRVRPAVAGPGFLSRKSGFGWAVFAGAEGRAVGRNAFLEGTLFHGGPSVEPERLIGDFQAGLSLRYDGIELTYTHVLRTKEFQGQEEFSVFGSVNLRTKF